MLLGDPRQNPGHRERGPKRFSFTYEDIAQAAGIAVGSVKNAAAGRHATLDPNRLESVVEFINRRRGRQEGKAR
jgi:hypothetical protein